MGLRRRGAADALADGAAEALADALVAEPLPALQAARAKAKLK
jgi:hypothetical protein